MSEEVDAFWICVFWAKYYDSSMCVENEKVWDMKTACALRFYGIGSVDHHSSQNTQKYPYRSEIYTASVHLPPTHNTEAFHKI